jgi:hypothetical protein
VTIYKYEVELTMTGVKGVPNGIITRTEHAYTVIDAITQAAINATAEHPTGTIKVRHVGPPMDAIMLSEATLAQAVGEMLSRLGKGKKTVQ